MVNLSQKLYEIITKDGQTKVILMIDSNDDAIVAFETDIGLSKLVYLRMFKQVWTQWHEWDKETMENTWELYYMTIGYFVTTNENHTLLLLHEKLVNLLIIEDPQFINKEINLISTLLCSRLKRINKSSSLWFLLQKLIQQENDFNMELIVERVFLSCQHHFANYYANNFLKFLIRDGYGDIIGGKLLLACKSNLRDVSLWSTLEVWLETNLKEGKNILLWLINVQCAVKYPFTVIVRLVLRKFDNKNYDALNIDELSDLLVESLLESNKVLLESNEDSIGYSKAVARVSTMKDILEYLEGEGSIV